MSSVFKQFIAIVDLGSGNLRSVEKAVARAAETARVDADVYLTQNAEDIVGATRIVLPGVGAFSACMEGLVSRPGMKAALEAAVFIDKKPILGICVGMQIMATKGLEYGETPGLNWIAGTVEKLSLTAPDIRIPHMGWNRIIAQQNHNLFGERNELSEVDFYFLHSYHFKPDREKDCLARCDYGQPIVATIGCDNIIGTQFHPEKSQGAGQALLQNFLRWQP